MEFTGQVFQARKNRKHAIHLLDSVTQGGSKLHEDTLHQGCLPSSLTGSLNKLELNIFKNLHVFKDE